MKIVSDVKQRLGIADNSRDKLLWTLIDDTVQSILNYCNRSDFPPELSGVVARMACDAFNEAFAQEQALKGGAVSSVSEAGRSVSFITAETAARISSLAHDRIPKLTEISRFSLLYKSQ